MPKAWKVVFNRGQVYLYNPAGRLSDCGLGHRKEDWLQWCTINHANFTDVTAEWNTPGLVRNPLPHRID